MLWLGIALACVGALCFAAAAELQHGAVHAVTGTGSRWRVPVLLRDRHWLLGLLALASGAGLHTLALAVAPLAVVQPIGVLAVVISTLFAARRRRGGIQRGELVALLLTVSGVSGFVVLASSAQPAPAVPDPDTALRAGTAIGALVAVLVALGWSRSGIGRCVGLASAAAACYALVSVLTRIGAVQLRVDGWSAQLLVPAAGIVAAVLVGGWLIQHAYAGGAPDLVLACLTVGDPVVAVAFGMAVLGEAVPSSLLSGLAQAGCAAVAAVGILVLARNRNNVSVHNRPIVGSSARTKTTDWSLL